MADISHPLFARFFDRLSHVMEKELAPRRDELLAGLSGRVLELGAGNGINFSHYPGTVEEVIAVEPEPYMRAKAERAALEASVRVTVRPGVAHALEFADASLDGGVASLVLCSVHDQSRALAELRRVIRPGGELRFLEHVRGSTARKVRASDDRRPGRDLAAGRRRLPLQPGHGGGAPRGWVRDRADGGSRPRTRVEHHQPTRAGARRPVTSG